MSRNQTHDPWRVGSESEDESVPSRVTNTPRLTTSQVSVVPTTPKVADWNPLDDIPTPDKIPTSDKIGERSENIYQVPSNSRRSSLSSDSSSKSGREVCQSVPSIIPEPSDENSSAETNPATTPCTFDPFEALREDLTKFVYTPIPKDYPHFLQCRLQRDRSGMQRGFLPTFFLHAERPSDNKKFFLLAARKVGKMNRQLEYVITVDFENLSKRDGGEGNVGKLRGNNLSGTEYTLYDNGISPNRTSSKYSNGNETIRRELAGIVYSPNVLGIKGPRQISTMLPKIGHDIQPAKKEDGILDMWRDRRLNPLIQLRNRTPKLNDETKTYVLQFIGNRVAQPSVKNFQMIMEDETNEERVVMQFGRVNKETFSCDFRYPFSPIQAFAIALSSFDSRISRE